MKTEVYLEEFVIYGEVYDMIYLHVPDADIWLTDTSFDQDGQVLIELDQPSMFRSECLVTKIGEY